jgi:lipopolysaccharide transport system permease protein
MRIHGDQKSCGIVEDAAADPRTVVPQSRTLICRSQGWLPVNLAELWDYRELIWFLIWRDLKVRYRQTVLGALWAVIQPFSMMIVFSVFFGKLGGIPSDGLPYPLFSFTGLVLWLFFAQGLGGAANSLIANQDLIRKVYFPRLTVPIAAVLTGVADFSISFSMLIVMLMFYGVFPTADVLWLPVLALLTIATALGAGLWLAAWNVRYRDVRHMLPFLVQLWMFLSPVAYPSSLLSEPWRTLYGLNPMAGVVEGFRWALLGARISPGPIIGLSAVTSLIMLTSGAYYFRRMERWFADLI